MALLDIFKKKEHVDESIKAFANKGNKTPTLKKRRNEFGEGVDDIRVMEGYGNVGLSSFNIFYDNYINKEFENEIKRIYGYREMSEMSEISDIIEDATNESTQKDMDGNVISLEITNKEIFNNDNKNGNLNKEFKKLFYDNIDINNKIWDMVRTYLIDGRLFYERIIDKAHPRKGIINIKKLPSETVDYFIDPQTGWITNYFQYLTTNPKRPVNKQEAEKLQNLVLFEPEQIGFANYGVYGKTKNNIIGFLERARIPYNQLKLLETSVIIYRIIRAPERLVFRIDTGNMPRDKALKYVEQIKNKMTKKQTYNPTTGQLTHEPEILCIRKNTEIPLLDGRNLTLDNIIKEHEKGKENWVYTINQNTSNIEPGRIKNAKLTRFNEKLIRTWFDNKNYIDTTYDHKFILRDGRECRADELEIGQSLMPLYRKEKQVNPRSKTQLYDHVYNPATNKWISTHKMVTNYYIGDIKNNEIRHHIDYNRFNNNPTNLKIMDTVEHFRFHSKRWINDYKGQYNVITEGHKKWMEVPENKKRHSEWVIRTNIEQNKAEKMRKVLNTPEVRARQKEAVKNSKLEWFANEDNKRKFKKKKTIKIDGYFIGMVCKIFLENSRPIRNKLVKKLNENKQLIQYLKIINKDRYPRSNFVINRNILGKVMDKLKYKDYPEFRECFAYPLNHKVTKIEYLDQKDDTGCIEVEGNHNFAVSQDGEPLVFIRNSLLENFYMPQSADGRGSQVETVGGNPSGFSELDDIYYFSRKLYRALKYPLSRVSAGQEKREADIMFGGGNTGEISRDEIKWAKFLERQQEKICETLTDTFLLHLDFTGLKEQYGITKDKINIKMNPPSHYKEQMEQNFIESRFNNYTLLADREEFSKYFLMKKMLKWDDDDIKENKESFKKDKEMLPKEEDEGEE